MGDKYHVLAHHADALDKVGEHDLALAVTFQGKRPVTHLHLGVVAHDVLAHVVEHLASGVDDDGLAGNLTLLQLGQCVQCLVPGLDLQGGALVRLVYSAHAAVEVEQHGVGCRQGQCGVVCDDIILSHIQFIFIADLDADTFCFSSLGCADNVA